MNAQPRDLVLFPTIRIFLGARLLALAIALSIFGLGITAVEASAQQDPVAQSPTEPDPLDRAFDAVEERGVALAQFTTAVEEREPIDQITFVQNDVRKIYFYSDLRGLQGTSVTHRWTHDGKTRAEVRFEVKGPRWRVWSTKELDPEALGDWTVEIVTEDGETLAAETFTYSAPGR